MTSRCRGGVVWAGAASVSLTMVGGGGARAGGLPSGVIAEAVNPSNGRTYYLLEEMTWSASRARAEELGGQLVTIDHAAEQAWVWSTFGNFGGVSRHLWIGLHRGGFGWIWASGATNGFRNWDEDEPNNSGGNEDVVNMSPTTGGGWNDVENNEPIENQSGEWNGVVELGSFNAGETDPSPFSVPLCPKPPGAKHLVLITHGWRPGYLSWSLIPESTFLVGYQELQCVLAERLSGINPDDWHVCLLNWLDWSTQPTPEMTAVFGLGVGRAVGTEIASLGYDHVHFIGHSAGSWVIEAAARRLGALDGSTTIHCTFLDPYAGVVPLSAPLGSAADWSDNYVSTGGDPFTDVALRRAYNVDVQCACGSALDPAYQCLNGVHAHFWPVKWYQWSVYCGTGFGPTCAAPCAIEGAGEFGVGFPLALDGYGGGAWAPPGIGVGNAFDTPCGTRSEGTGPTDALVARYSEVLDLTALVVDQGPAGSVNVQQSLVELSVTAGEVAWLTMAVPTGAESNFLSFDIGFTSSDPAAEGLMTAYWNAIEIGSVDERFPSGPPVSAPIPDPIAGTHTLTLRLGEFASTDSAVEISNIRLGESFTIDADVNLDGVADDADYCDWFRSPVDLDGDLVADEADAGFIAQALDADATDVNANGLPDVCDVCVADFDGDFDTDVFDFNVFAPAFGSSGLPPFTGGDLDGDGDVDVFDFNMFAPDFGCSG